MRTNTIGVVAGITKVKPYIATLDPAQLRKLLPQGALLGLNDSLCDVATPQYPDPWHPLVQLSAQFQRTRDGRAADQCDELAPSHSITWSPMANRPGGTSMPGIFAVCSKVIILTQAAQQT